MSYPVGAVEVPAAVQEDLDGLVTLVGSRMDDARKVRFRATVEALEAYLADSDEDRCIDVAEPDVVKVWGFGGRSLWSRAGLPWSIG